MRVSVLCGLLSLAAVALSSVVSAGTQRVVSPRMQAVLRLDQQYSQMQAKAEAANKLEQTVQQIPTNAPYDYDTATQLFWHSVTAYCTDNSNLADWTCASCNQFGPFTVTGIMDDTTNQGYVGYFTQGLPAAPIPGTSASDPFVLVSMRGTVPSDLSDWIEDLSFSKFSAFSSRYPSVSVHSGFWESYQAMKPGMLSALRTAIAASGAKTILVTGHSLGGAMAELAAIDLKLNVYPSMKYATYTQGCPRVGNPAFATLYDQMIDASFREVHQADCVPHLPPKLLGFSHAPMEIWFDEAFDSYHYCSGSPLGEDSSCSDSLLLPVSVSDHVTYRGISMGGYCSSADKNKDAVRMPAARPVNVTVSVGGKAHPKRQRIILKN